MRNKTTPVLTVLLAAMLVYTSGVAATAVEIITGYDIKDGSITRADIKDGTITKGKIKDDTLTSTEIRDDAITGAEIQDGAITGAEIKDGSIKAADLAPTSTGGSSGDTIHEWTYTHTADGATDLSATSTDTIPAKTQIGSIGLSVNGLDSVTCPGAAYAYLSVNGAGNIADYNSSHGVSSKNLTVGSTGTDGAKPLSLFVMCQDNNGNYLPLPTFTVTYLFSQTPAPAGMAAPFH